MYEPKQTIYGVRAFERITEDDPRDGAVMYSTSGFEGPWHDMVTGCLDFCWEVFEALTYLAEDRAARLEEEKARLRDEIQGFYK